MNDQISGDNPVLILRLPPQLSDEAAYYFCEFFYDMAGSIENHYSLQIKRYWKKLKSDDATEDEFEGILF